MEEKSSTKPKSSPFLAVQPEIKANFFAQKNNKTTINPSLFPLSHKIKLNHSDPAEKRLANDKKFKKKAAISLPSKSLKPITKVVSAHSPPSSPRNEQNTRPRRNSIEDPPTVPFFRKEDERKKEKKNYRKSAVLQINLESTSLSSEISKHFKTQTSQTPRNAKVSNTKSHRIRRNQIVFANSSDLTLFSTVRFIISFLLYFLYFLSFFVILLAQLFENCYFNLNYKIVFVYYLKIFERIE